MRDDLPSDAPELSEADIHAIDTAIRRASAMPRRGTGRRYLLGAARAALGAMRTG
jgi:hypothetical protein